MRSALLILSGIVCCCPLARAQEELAKPMPFKLVGDETSLQKVKAEPQTFLAKPFVVTGEVKIDDTFMFGYENAHESHYSLYFFQAVNSEATGEGCWLYLRRKDGKEIVDKILSKTAGKEKAYVTIRAKVVIDPRRYDKEHWDFLELLDVQFGTEDAKGWGPWVIETRQIEEAKANEKENQALIEGKKQRQLAEEKAKEQRQLVEDKAKEKDRAERTRTWKDTSGKFSVVAEYSGIAKGVVSLRKKDGSVLKVPIEKLNEADRKWLDQRRKSSAGERPKQSK